MREDLACFGLSPEMLQQVTKLVRAQAATSGDGGPAMAEPQAVERGDDGLALPLDRDERGYGEF
ncbi:MAG: hypothetical protein SXV54_03620 [Chloroflexota bacterium]|nr:hypothetical protein [Chloroflexota bacterium]